ncbi:MAG: GGDEF domain-containing protein [Eggerthellaceae bacterium]|nr:GGDEF domain-containing protein [Eggerthellaceae bacterium]
MSDHVEATIEELKPADASHGGISIRIIGAITIVVAILLAFFAFTLAGQIADVKATAETDEARYVECSDAINDLQDASDYLTTQARMFVVTGDPANMDAYFEELYTTDRRGSAVNLLRTSFSEDLQSSADLLQTALDKSDELAENEFVAMRLAAEYYGVKDAPKAVMKSAPIEGEQNMTPDQKIEAAREIMLGADYVQAKSAISQAVEASSSALLDELNAELEANNALMETLLFQLRISVALLLCVVMVLVLVLLMYVLKPLNHYIKRIEKNEPLEADGSYELRYLATAYNTMYEDNSRRIKQLREFAERDPLTGIANREGYDTFLATHTRNIALLLIDIDNFKEFNKVYGRDTGNAVMVKLANALSTAFRSTDFPCRIESDLFAVIMTDMSENLHDAVSNKIGLVNTMLADDSDDLPLITLSVGAAFSTEGMSDHDIYEAAETALARAVKNGRNCIAFYGEGNVPAAE